MTSDPTSFPERLTEIDTLTRSDHHLLRFLGEYTARKGFSHSATNHLIINLKKPMDRKGTPQWQHKIASISKAARALHKALQGTDWSRITFVPVPPSKAKSDPLYDDRMMEMLRQLADIVQKLRGISIDFRELAIQPSSVTAAHDGDNRPSPAELAAGYKVDQALLKGVRSTIIICDDVLTTGSHFRAMSDTLRPFLPQAQFMGLFVARRAPESSDFSNFFK